MDKLQTILDYYQDEEFLVADGFNDAIIGVSDGKLVYSNQRCVEILMIRDGMSMEDAIEFFDFNVQGCIRW